MQMTVTITDHTKPARNLYDLATNGSGTGYTVVGGLSPLNIGASVCYLSIQASYGNSSTIIYKGNASVANDGSAQEKEMQAGDVDVQQAVQFSVSLNEIYVRASADNGKFNVESHHG